MRPPFVQGGLSGIEPRLALPGSDLRARDYAAVVCAAGRMGAGLFRWAVSVAVGPSANPSIDGVHDATRPQGRQVCLWTTEARRG
jgi:hypothetical protein